MQNSLPIILLSITMLFGSIDANTQNTFSQRFHFDRAANVFTGIEIEEDGFWIKGISASMDPSYRTGNVIAKFDFDGNVLLTQFLESERPRRKSNRC